MCSSDLLALHDAIDQRHEPHAIDLGGLLKVRDLMQDRGARREVGDERCAGLDQLLARVELVEDRRVVQCRGRARVASIDVGLRHDQEARQGAEAGCRCDMKHGGARVVDAIQAQRIVREEGADRGDIDSSA